MNNEIEQVYNKRAVDWYFKHPVKYAQHTDLTTVPNEVCFLAKDRRVIMQGFSITSLERISYFFDISVEQIRQVIHAGISLYDLSEKLKWKEFKRCSIVANSLEEFKRKTVGDEYISLLKMGLTNLMISEYGRGLIMEDSILDRIPEEERGHYMVGPMEVKLSHSEDSSKLKEVFDFATVSVTLIGVSLMNKEKRKETVGRYKRVIDRYVVDALKKDRRIKKTGLSIDMLKCDRCVLTHDCILVYTFSWKFEDSIKEEIKQ